MPSFSHKTYVNLRSQSSELAKQYRIDCWLEKPVEIQEKEVTRDELKDKLNNADIKYFKWAKTEKLLELCIENNLI